MLEEKRQPRLEATKKLRLVCKNWYECLRWNVLFSQNVLSLKVCCFHKISGELSQRLKSEINDEKPLQNESMLPVTMFFTPKKLEECKIPLYPNCLIIEHGFQLPSQFNLQGVCKLVIAKDQASSQRYEIIDKQLKKLLKSIGSESLKTLIFDDMYITNERLLFLSSRFSKLEYLGLPNCTIHNPDIDNWNLNIHWEMFSSLKILTLTLWDLFSCIYDNIVLHLNTKTGRSLKFDPVMRDFM
jgi:hypothetical protein